MPFGSPNSLSENCVNSDKDATFTKLSPERCFTLSNKGRAKQTGPGCGPDALVATASLKLCAMQRLLREGAESSGQAEALPQRPDPRPPDTGTMPVLTGKTVVVSS